MAPSAVRPNVLVIEADDLREDELRWMPRTRRLIEDRGLRFRNSFASDPLCSPSRASFLTGRAAHNHGVLTHDDPYGFHAFDDRDTLATRLRSVGYRTGFVGKYINGYGEQPTRGGRDSLRYVPPGWSRWLGASDHAWQPGEAFRGGTYDYFSLTSNVDGTIRSWPGEYTTDVTGRQTRDVIARFAAAPGKAPWFVWWTPVAPHHGTPVESDDPGTTVRTDGHLTTWVSPARPDRVKGRFDRLIRHGAGTPARGSAEADVSDKPAYIRSYPELDRAERAAETTVTRQRAEALSVLDGQIARTLRSLRRQGQADDTIVMVTSDNGYYLGEHRRRQGKVNLHEPSIRVPLLMIGPGIAHGQRFDPVTTLDLPTTIAAYAGVRLRDPDGVDLRPTIERDRGWRRPVLLEGLMPEPRYRAARTRADWAGGEMNTIGLRTGRWNLVRYATGERELYDLRADPGELRSLQRTPRARPVLLQLERILRRYVDCSGAECRRPLPPSLRVGP